MKCNVPVEKVDCVCKNRWVFLGKIGTFTNFAFFIFFFVTLAYHGVHCTPYLLDSCLAQE